MEPNAKRKMNSEDYTKCFLKFDDETMMKVPGRTIYQVSLRFATLERPGFGALGFCHKTPPVKHPRSFKEAIIVLLVLFIIANICI